MLNEARNKRLSEFLGLTCFAVGLMLLIAVIFNNFVRKRVTESR